jgi:hypothetical protein
MRRALCLVALAGLPWGPQIAQANGPMVDPSSRGELRASAVPVLLPSLPLPRAFGVVRSVAVVSAGRRGYYVGYSSVERCAGALSCASFHVAGFAAPARLEPARYDRPARLFDGTRAVFRPRDCSGAGCTESSLFFKRRDTLYELDAKVADDDFRALAAAYRTLRKLR